MHLHPKDMFLESIPVRGWRTFNLWIKDPQIKVEGDEELFTVYLQNIFRGADGVGQSSSGVTELVRCLQLIMSINNNLSQDCV